VRLLLDTHIFLCWRADAPDLPERARAAILDVTNDVYVSGAVGWEIVIKRALGKLDFDGTVGVAVAEEGFTPLSVDLAHVDEVARLPGHHRDPFDRLLVAQAIVESLTLVTADPQVRAYDAASFLSL
jgi:PIN domain nuclease of toxin-antitoxin system